MLARLQNVKQSCRQIQVRANRLQHVGGASAVARPEILAGSTHLEDAYDADVQEQLHLTLLQAQLRPDLRRNELRAPYLQIDRVRQLVTSDDRLVFSVATGS